MWYSLGRRLVAYTTAETTPQMISDCGTHILKVLF